MPLIQIINVVKTLLSLGFLTYASLSDYKTREVSNKVWVFFAPPAFALTFTELFLFDFSMLPYYGLCFGLTSAIALIIFYAGGFGGADAKALMCLALALPFYPQNLLTPLHGEISPTTQILFPLAVFSNSILLAAATAIYMLIHNIFWRIKTGKTLFEENHQKEPFGKKLLVLVTGYKVSVEKLKEKWHLYPLEDVEENAEKGFKRKLVMMPRDERRNAIVERLAKAVETGKIQNKVWATPGLPMLIFITVGLIITLFFGDIVWICIRLILG